VEVAALLFLEKMSIQSFGYGKVPRGNDFLNSVWEKEKLRKPF